MILLIALLSCNVVLDYVGTPRWPLCWVGVIFFACVWGGVLDLTTASDNPGFFYFSVFHYF
jgi:hypothetical protein